MIVVKCPYVIIGWNKHYTPPTLDFKFDFLIPSPRKYPVILARDKKGRIITSKFPPMAV